ncbi:dTDP-4-dehydrorhamnose 3,5-epimerase [Nocardiopsis arvandica]|uniref:dTDP-4-dehydrorhamnose 3,5-epimerase n=1 Tax=Nocardiopsis sinuspersici TaxID=501010 RepID=A0A7Z0BLX8_9ACTN|nr:dTDP-4-dehydrorhamnose 3,5-epimerase [Nocardiopsis sinuspersici]NYH55681.1 dTDP-4-dehydrorhamnose 3,5-epimerase [Nocardiopsis sinuspersici]
MGSEPAVNGEGVFPDGEGPASTVPDVWRVGLAPHEDVRGRFVEVFHQERFSAVSGRDMAVRQANYSVSRRGVVRGVHYFADSGGQAKYVTCVSGEVIDVAVDLRVGSPTYGQWESVRMDASCPRAVHVPVGLGHAFVALSDEAVMLYLCDAPYVPGLERTVHPLDPELALPWPDGLALTLSERDRSAPSLAGARAAGLLPPHLT